MNFTKKVENVVLVFFFLISNSFSANQKPLQVNLRKKTPTVIHCQIHFLHNFDHSEIIESWKTSFFLLNNDIELLASQ